MAVAPGGSMAILFLAKRAAGRGRKVNRILSSSSGRERLIPLLLFAAGCGWFLSASPHAWRGFPLDDAWIHQVYARSFAAGAGFAYNPGSQATGATSPLWVVATAPAHWLTRLIGPELIAPVVKGIGMLLGIIGLCLLHAVARRLGLSRRGALLALSIVAVDPVLLFSSLSGMETPLVLCLSAGSLLLLLCGRLPLSALLLGLATLARPEAAVLLPLWPAAAGLAHGRAALGRTVMAWPISWLPGLGWSLYCLIVTGHPLPATWYRKAGEGFRLDWERLERACSIVTLHGHLSLIVAAAGLTAFLVWCLASGRRRQRGAALLVLLAGPLVWTIGVAGTRHLGFSGYYWQRYLEPPVLLLTFACCCGLGALFPGGVDKASPPPSGRFRTGPILPVLRLAAALLALVSIVPFARSLDARRDRYASDCSVIERMNVAAGRWIEANAPADARVAANDAGAIRYFGNRWTLDVHGLNSPELSFGQTTASDLIDRLGIDWLAVFPWWHGNLPQRVGSRFFERRLFSVPYDEYTICHCPGQTDMQIYRRTAVVGGDDDV